MKKSLVFLTFLLLSISINAQTPQFSVGIVGSHFHNNSSSDRISEANNPFGYGLVFAGKFSEELSMGLTFEYLKDNLEFNNGEEKDYRASYSVFLHPFKTQYVQPYLSAGVVYTYRKLTYDNKADDSKNLLNGRFSVGVDIPVISNLYINGDLGTYSNGFGFVGWGSTLGFRFAL
jgi:hypothetical protein